MCILRVSSLGVLRVCEHVCLYIYMCFLCFFFGSFSCLVVFYSLICLFLIIIVLCCIVLLFLIIIRIIIVCFLRRETKAMNLDGRGARENLGGIVGEETIIRKYLMKKRNFLKKI